MVRDIVQTGAWAYKEVLLREGNKPQEREQSYPKPPTGATKGSSQAFNCEGGGNREPTNGKTYKNKVIINKN